MNDAKNVSLIITCLSQNRKREAFGAVFSFHGKQRSTKTLWFVRFSLRDLGGDKRVVSGQTIDIMKKPNMFRVLVTTVSMAAFALASSPAHGQGSPVPIPPDGAQATASPVEHLKVERDGVFVKLPGKGWDDGSGPANVGNAVKALRVLYPKDTFWVDPRVAEMPVTDMVVRANDPMTDLQALRTCCGGRFNFTRETNELYSIVYNRSSELNLGENRKIECFNLTHYLEREKTRDKDEANKPTGQSGVPAAVAIDQLQDIIKQTLADFDPTAANQLHFRFYNDAQLLIVIGPGEAIEVAAKVINALPGQPPFMGNGFGGGDSGDFQGNFQELQMRKAARDADAMKADDIFRRLQQIPDSRQGTKP